MAEIEDNVDRELFRNVEKLRQLRIEHRDLDEVISRLSLDLHIDELQLKRLKKRKLHAQGPDRAPGEPADPGSERLMDSAESALRGVARCSSTSPPVLVAGSALLIAGLAASAVARALRARRAGGRTRGRRARARARSRARGRRAHRPDPRGARDAARRRTYCVGALGVPTAPIDGAARAAGGAGAWCASAVYVLGLLLGPDSWVRTPREPHHARAVADRRCGRPRLARRDRGQPEPHQPGPGPHAVQPVGAAQGPGGRHRLRHRHQPDRARHRAPRHAARSAGGLHPRRRLEVHLLPAGRPGRAARASTPPASTSRRSTCSPARSASAWASACRRSPATSSAASCC